MVSLRSGKRSARIAVTGFGIALAACSGSSDGVASPQGTVNLTCLPAAEAWVDGKAAGTTPLAVTLCEGHHDVVLRQAGFAERKESLDLAAGAVCAVDATLDALDPTNVDTVRQIASAFGVTVDPFQAPELHRGAEADRGVALMYPRNDVRREGLTTYRADVTPAYDGTGWLEFHKGKTVLYRERFVPEKLVTTSNVPAAVSKSVKVGDRVTWGVYFQDERKPITAEFEVVAKPAAAKKIAEIEGDRRLARQPKVLRLALEAEALQNYRLYSEALMKLLESRELDKDSTTPYTGIVSCLRRLDLDDTALFTEAASRVIGRASNLRGGGELASRSTPRPVSKPSSAPASSPASKGAGFGSTGGLPSRAGPSPAPTPTPSDDAGTPSGPDASGTPSMNPAPDRSSLLRQEADHLARVAAEEKQMADKAAGDAAAAKAAADAAKLAADTARAAIPAEGGPDADVAARAALEAEQAALNAEEAARVAAARAAELAAHAARAADAATHAGNLATPSDLPTTQTPSPVAGTSPTPTPTPTPAPSPTPTPPTNAAPSHPVLPTPPLAPPIGVDPATPATEAQNAAVLAATTAFATAQTAARDAQAAFEAAQQAANESPDDADKRAAVETARSAAELALQRAADARAALDRLTGPR